MPKQDIKQNVNNALVITKINFLNNDNELTAFWQKHLDVFAGQRMKTLDPTIFCFSWACGLEFCWQQNGEYVIAVLEQDDQVKIDLFLMVESNVENSRSFFQKWFENYTDTFTAICLASDATAVLKQVMNSIGKS